MRKSKTSGGTRCAVFGCKNSYNNTKDARDRGENKIMFHSFPKTSDVATKWVNACGRKGVINIRTSRICSKHFNDQDYARDLKNELLGLPLKRILKKSAVPSIAIGAGVCMESFTAEPVSEQMIEEDEVEEQEEEEEDTSCVVVKEEIEFIIEDSGDECTSIKTEEDYL